MYSKFLDPKNDFAFRKVFGSEKNKDILIHFLNDVVVFKENLPICDVTFLKTIQDPEIAAKKTSIVDVLCKDEKGNQYIVEMQVAKQEGFEKRAQYYASKAYCSQVDKGGIYEDLKEVIFIAICDFVLFPEKDAYQSDHLILDRDNHEHNLKDLYFTFIELPKFSKGIHELKSIVDKWIYFFKHADDTTEQDLDALIGQDDIIERAYEELNRLSWNEEEMLTYSQEEKYEKDYAASMRQKFKEGLDQGRDEGREEGIIESKRLIAKNMLLQGLDVAFIAQVTGLSEMMLENMREEVRRSR